MKKFLSAIVVAVVMIMTFSTVLASVYVGNSKSKKFHQADCSFVGRMKSSNLVYFNTRDEAIGAGYIPCKRCNP